MDGQQEKMEKSADADKKASDMEDDKNTNRNKGGTEEENWEEIKTPYVQDIKKQDTDEELASVVEATKENTTGENNNNDTERKE